MLIEADGGVEGFKMQIMHPKLTKINPGYFYSQKKYNFFWLRGLRGLEKC